MKANHLYLRALPLFFASILVFSSCDDDDDNVPIGSTGIIGLSTKLQNPAVANRQETGVLNLYLKGTELHYDLTVKDLASTDQLTMAHFHAGDPLTNGPVIFDFMPTFNGNRASGVINIRQSLVDSLMNSSNEIYFNVHSQQQPSGLIRGQVNSDIILAADLNLTGAQQIPAVTTTAMGMAALRLTTTGMLYSKVSVQNLESADMLSMSHIHQGGATENGAVIINLCEGASDFGMIKKATLSAKNVSKLLTASTYVNVHSTLYPNGIIRAQLK